MAMASSYRTLLHTNPANAFVVKLYLRVKLSHDLLVLTMLTVGVPLLSVRMSVDSAETNVVVVAAARAVAAAVVDSKAFHANKEALDTAGMRLGCIVARWKRLFMRAMLLHVVGLSLAACFLTMAVLEGGFFYRTCPPAGLGKGGEGSWRWVMESGVGEAWAASMVGSVRNGCVR